jgi:peptidoglycan/xylan/chitin deacetylase (PgdA/CDA1 family)
MRSNSFLAIFFAVLLSVPVYGASIDLLIVEHGPRDSNMVALTFDACPTGRDDEYDERVIEALITEKVPATLFMSGRWVEKNAGRAKFLADQPQFEIANHAFWHPHMLEKDDERIVRELRRTQAVIKKATGRGPKYFRPPFGEVDERLATLASQAGLVTIQYDIASGDPDPGLSAKRIARAVVEEAKGGSIVVLHMNRNGVRTAEALPEIVKGLREKGFDLVTVGEMLKTADTGTRRRGDGGTGQGKGKTTRGQGDAEIKPAATASMEPSHLVSTSLPKDTLHNALHSSGEATMPDAQNAGK